MKDNHYLDNARFEALIRDYAEGDRDNEEELINMFDILITNILRGFWFNVEVDDAKQDCYVLVLKILPNFNKESGSAFNYFTTVILNNLRLIYAKNKRYTEKMIAYQEHVLGYTPSSS